jgi:hypothetical protein
VNRNGEDRHVLVIDGARYVKFVVYGCGPLDDYDERKNFFGNRVVDEEDLSGS